MVMSVYFRARAMRNMLRSILSSDLASIARTGGVSVFLFLLRHSSFRLFRSFENKKLKKSVLFRAQKQKETKKQRNKETKKQRNKETKKQRNQEEKRKEWAAYAPSAARS
jgi:hypothetical protein